MTSPRQDALTGDPAQLRFNQDGTYTVLRNGRFVVCAVSGARIPMEAVRYWNVERQEAYAGPAEATEAWRRLNLTG